MLCGLIAALATGVQACGSGEDGSSIVQTHSASPAGPSRSAINRPTAPSRTEQLPTGVVAQAGKHLITEPMLDRWLMITAGLIYYEGNPHTPASRGLVPNPPDYRGCIAYLAATAMNEHRQVGRKPLLRRLCQLRRDGLSSIALERLIVMAWVHDAAAKARISLSTREVDHALRTRFRSPGGLRRFLRFTGLRPSDARLLVRAELLKDRLTLTLPVYERLRNLKGRETKQMAREVDSEAQHLSERLAARGTRVTHCRAGYVVRGCIEFNS